MLRTVKGSDSPPAGVCLVFVFVFALVFAGDSLVFVFVLFVFAIKGSDSPTSGGSHIVVSTYMIIFLMTKFL